MLPASLYIIVCSARNRVRMRLRRLREPRYLLGAIVGVAYMYFSFFGRLAAGRGDAIRRRRRAMEGSPFPLAVLAGSGPGVVGFLLLGLTTATWLMPYDSSLLTFSRAEIQFLFPAPVSRRWLLVHRMLRSQLGMLFAAVVVGLVAPSAPGYGRLRTAVAVWLLMCSMKLYSTGVSLARARLGAATAKSRRVAWLPVVVLTTVIAAVAFALTRAFVAAPAADFRDGFERLGAAASTGFVGVLMWPFMAVGKPLFTPWPGAYLWALLGSSLVLAGLAVWVLESDHAFSQAADDAVERQDGKPDGSANAYRTRAAGWNLGSTGPHEIAFAWKASMQTFRSVDTRAVFRVAVIILALTAAASSIGRRTALPDILSALALVGAVFAVLMAPQIVRVDMRTDLQHLEVLKTWPVPPAAVVRGELIWPGALLSACAWGAIVLAGALSSFSFSYASLGFRATGGIAAAILAPPLILAQLAIHNGTALLFPAWIPTGNQRPRGFDAMGQRLILLGGTWLALLVMAIPAAIAGGIVWFVMQLLVGIAAIIPAAVTGAVIILVEVFVLTELLGPLYERLDLTGVERLE